MLTHPLAGALLLGGVEDLVDEVIVRRAVFHAENVAGDLDEITFEFACVPFLKDLEQFSIGESKCVFEDEIGFANQLHVAVLDAVVHHLHIVPGTRVADPIAARNVIVRADFGGDFLEDILDEGPRFMMSAGHDARSFECALFTAGNAGPDEAITACFEIRMPTIGVAEVAVAAVDDDVALRQQRLELIDHRVHRRTGFDHNHHPPRRFETAHEFFQRVITLDAVDSPRVNFVGWFIFQATHEFISRGGGPIVNPHGEAVIGHVQDKVLAHDGQTDQTDIVLHWTM